MSSQSTEKGEAQICRPLAHASVLQNPAPATTLQRAFKEDIPNQRRELPRQFDDATNKTIELIDILWLESDAIIAAFEVEHTAACRLVCTIRSKSMCLFEEEFDVFLIAEARSCY